MKKRMITAVCLALLASVLGACSVNETPVPADTSPESNSARQTLQDSEEADLHIQEKDGDFAAMVSKGQEQHVTKDISANVKIDADISIPESSQYDIVKIKAEDWSNLNYISETFAALPRGILSALPFNGVNVHFNSSNQPYLEQQLPFMSRDEAAALVRDKLNELNVPAKKVVAIYGVTELELKTIYEKVKTSIAQLPESEKREGYDYTLPTQTFDFSGGWYRLYFAIEHAGIPIYNRDIVQYEEIPVSEDEGYGFPGPVVSAWVSKNGIETLSFSGELSYQSTIQENTNVIPIEDVLMVLQDIYSNESNTENYVFKSISLEYLVKPESFSQEALKNERNMLTPVWVCEGVQDIGGQENYLVTFIDGITGKEIRCTQTTGSFLGGM